MKTMDNLGRKLSRKVGRLFVGAVMKTADLGAGAANWGACFKGIRLQSLPSRHGFAAIIQQQRPIRFFEAESVPTGQ